jgi:8-oxo-dGTP pyrophosphatase MutT (NUDIX family)
VATAANRATDRGRDRSPPRCAAADGGLRRRGAIKGWRPLGGSIEFGERAADALKREFAEEIGEAVSEPKLLSVIENLYTHHDAAGHEIVFVFETSLIDERAYAKDAFSFHDGGVHNDVRWVALTRFRSGEEQLFPDRLLGIVDDLTPRT